MYVWTHQLRKDPCQNEVVNAEHARALTRVPAGDDTRVILVQGCIQGCKNALNFQNIQLTSFTIHSCKCFREFGGY